MPSPQKAQAHQSNQSNAKTAEVQNQVQEVIGIMQNNIEKVVERGEKIETLQNKTEELQQGALSFKKSSNAVQSAMWWKDFKLNLIIGAVTVGVAVIIIVAVVPR